MVEKADKIRVLLLDDNPSSLNLIHWVDGVRCESPQVSDSATTDFPMPELDQFFDLRWLASAAEAREFRDLSLLVSRATPDALIREGWVPEILCFDYALTGFDKSIGERFFPEKLTDSLSPLPNLRRYVKACDLPLPESSDVPYVDVAQGHDNYGCFAGGLIFTTFSDHPCGPVALTCKGNDKTVGMEASFFEWMLENEAHGTFQRKGRHTPQWRELIPDGLRVLRSRIEELAAGSIIRVSLDDLIALAASGKHEVLTIRSRYGLRRLPVPALFLDYKQWQREDAARGWADWVLEKIFSGAESGFRHTLDDFIEGRNLANILWAAYDSDESARRVRLSELLVKQKELNQLTTEEETELEELKRHFGVKSVEARAPCDANYVDIRDDRFTDRQKRWAALIIIVQLLARAAKVRNKLEGSQSPDLGEPGFDYSLCQPLTAADVYLALFPVARHPLTLPFHQGEPGAIWGKPLTRLDDDRRDPSLRNDQRSWGSIALRINDVLNGLPWREDPQQPQSEWTYGLMPGERQVLQHFAHSIGFGDDEWEKDSQARQILKPLGR